MTCPVSHTYLIVRSCCKVVGMIHVFKLCLIVGPPPFTICNSCFLGVEFFTLFRNKLPCKLQTSAGQQSCSVQMNSVLSWHVSSVCNTALHVKHSQMQSRCTDLGSRTRCTGKQHGSLYLGTSVPYACCQDCQCLIPMGFFSALKLSCLFFSQGIVGTCLFLRHVLRGKGRRYCGKASNNCICFRAEIKGL